jgi:RNA polymerase sigma-B factor
VRALPVPASRAGQGVAGLDDGELLRIVGSLPPSSERRAAAYELLVARYGALVRSCVQRYKCGPELAEDLMQVGYLGLVKAISNFDPAFGRSLGAYARPCITGEIKRHFRDKRWLVHVGRPVQELVLEVRVAAGQLTQQLGRMPADAELASHLGVSSAAIRDARGAELVLQPWSLDAPTSGQPGETILGDLLGEEDPRIEHLLGMRAIATHWGELPLREQRILRLRFQGDLTQAQIGQQLGMSQMQVCRLLAHALGYLRPRLLGLPECASGTAAAAPVPVMLAPPAATQVSRLPRRPTVTTQSLPLQTKLVFSRPAGVVMAGHDDHQFPGVTSRRRPGARIAAPHGVRAVSPHWMSRGACRGEDPELFFPIAAAGAALTQVRSAKAICARCPVQPNCLSYALATGQGDGIWGGTTREERWPARRLRSGPPAEPARSR